MIEHLVLSTLVLGVILVLVRVVPLTARTRYALLLCGIVKFAIPVVRVPSEVVPVPTRVFGADTAATTIAQAATPHIDWLPIAWASIAALLFARWIVLRTRTVSAALRDAVPASERETRIVRGARVPVDVVRSPMCEAPAVLRVRKPVIVLPSHGCEELDDDELRAVVLHECAHVRRRDNLATIVQALATSVLWFHPLVWLASRDLTAAREQACDETVADVMHETESYLSALAKICHALAAPPAGASCMASANLKQRLEHLMSYGSLKKRALSHGAAVIAAVLLIAASAIAGTTSQGEQPRPEDSEQSKRSEYSGQPISIRVKNANLKDLMNTFGELTGLDVAILRGAEDVAITMEVENMPWDEALEKMARDHNLVITLKGKTIEVAPKK